MTTEEFMFRIDDLNRFISSLGESPKTGSKSESAMNTSFALYETSAVAEMIRGFVEYARIASPQHGPFGARPYGMCFTPERIGGYTLDEIRGAVMVNLPYTEWVLHGSVRFNLVCEVLRTLEQGKTTHE